MTTIQPSTTPANVRRWKYGLNVVLLALIALTGVILLNALMTVRTAPQWDWTTGSIFTLSPRTKELLKQIDASGQDYELMNNFSAGTDQAQQVSDLLGQYARSGKHVTLYVPKDRDDLAQKIKSRFATENAAYEKAILAFDPLCAAITKFSKGQAADLTAAVQTQNLTGDDQRVAAAVVGLFKTVIPNQINEAKNAVQPELDATLPNWGRVVSAVDAALDPVLKQFQSTKDATADQVGKPLADFLASHAAAFAGIEKQITDFKDSLDKLPPIKSDEVLNSITDNTVTVFGPKTIKVIGQYDMFKTQAAANGSTTPPPAEFVGEQAISSALLAMVQPDKVKIVFVTPDPEQNLSGGLSEICDRLQKANFDVSEWSPAPPNPQSGQAEPTTPPTGKGVIWVIMPAQPQNPQMMMMGMPPPDPKPVVEALRKHLAAGGNAIYLAEAAGLSMSPTATTGYPYADLLKPYGIEVRTNLTVYHVVETQEGTRQPIPQIDFSTYPKHPITDGLDALPGIFAGTRGQMGPVGCPTVVQVAADKPGDADAHVIVESSTSGDIFATPEISSESDPKMNPKTDVAAPVPMAAASVIGDGHRTVVFGNRLFLVNDVLQDQQAELVGNRIVTVYSFPANAELFVNAANWVAGYGNMLAVSTQANSAMRIKSMPGNEEIALRIGSFLGPPLLAVLFGATVFFVRRYR
jgi:hypothetical protein